SAAGEMEGPSRGRRGRPLAQGRGGAGGGGEGGGEEGAGRRLGGGGIDGADVGGGEAGGRGGGEAHGVQEDFGHGKRRNNNRGAEFAARREEERGGEVADARGRGVAHAVGQGDGEVLRHADRVPRVTEVHASAELYGGEAADVALAGGQGVLITGGGGAPAGAQLAEAAPASRPRAGAGMRLTGIRLAGEAEARLGHLAAAEVVGGDAVFCDCAAERVGGEVGVAEQAVDVAPLRRSRMVGDVDLVGHGRGRRRGVTLQEGEELRLAADVVAEKGGGIGEQGAALLLGGEALTLRPAPALLILAAGGDKPEPVVGRGPGGTPRRPQPV